MWRLTTQLATAALTATLVLASTASEARSATVQSYTYSTDGNVGGLNNGPITFQPYYESTLTTPGSFVLGTIQTESLPATATLTYTNTPFTIDLYVAPQGSYQPYYGSPAFGSYEYQISGMLNGSINGAGVSSMMATITSITGFGWAPPFPVSDLVVAAPQGIAAPNGFSYGYSTLTAQVVPDSLSNPTPAPEPASIIVLGAAAAGWLLRRRARALDR
jgi:hypothetical protein